MPWTMSPEGLRQEIFKTRITLTRFSVPLRSVDPQQPKYRIQHQPPHPPALPRGVAKATERSSALVPLVCVFQVPPPFSVCRIMPVPGRASSTPTAQPHCGVAKATDQRSSRMPLRCGFQLPPPSSVCRMVPPLAYRPARQRRGKGNGIERCDGAAGLMAICWAPPSGLAEDKALAGARVLCDRP